MKIIYVFILTLYACALFGQADLLEKEGSKYIYKGKIYQCDDLDAVYKDHRESLDLYISGRSFNKAANITSYIGLAFIGVGAIGIGVGASADSIEGLIGVVFGILSVGAGVVLELLAITPKIIGKNKLKKARDTFNFEMMERHGYQSDTSLSFGVTGNGVGLVMTF